jgi:hypothetical protein
VDPIGVIETWAGIPTRSTVGFISNDDDIPDFITPLVKPNAIITIKGKGNVLNDSIQSWVLEEISVTGSGLNFDLRIWYPAAVSFEYLVWHSEHFAVEFKNLVLLIAGLF